MKTLIDYNKTRKFHHLRLNFINKTYLICRNARFIHNKRQDIDYPFIRALVADLYWENFHSEIGR